MPEAFGFVWQGLAAGRLALAAMGALIVITALHLLRERRRRVVVSFAPLWTAPQGTRIDDKLGRRMRRFASWIAQAGIAALMLLGAADPWPSRPPRPARSFVLLVDESASMKARTASGSRADDARAAALAFVADKDPHDRVLVAAFAANVRALTDFEANPATLAKAIDEVEPQSQAGNLEAALAFARAVLLGHENPQVVLVSDSAPSDRGVQLLRVGENGDNLAITTFGVRRTADSPSQIDVAITVMNASAKSQRVAVELQVGTAVPTKVLLDVAARASASQLRRVPVNGANRIHARLVLDRAAQDLIADDNQTSVAIPAAPRRRVLVVGPPNLYLDGALLSLAPGTTFDRIAPPDARSTAWAGYDAVVFDGAAPAVAPTRGRFLYLGGHGAGVPFADLGVIANPSVSTADRTHPLLEGVSVADVNVREARRWSAAPGDVVVAAALTGPLLLARDLGGLKIAALAFDVRHSDLPLRPALPLLVTNALQWLTGPTVAEAGSVEKPQSAEADTRMPARESAPSHSQPRRSTVSLAKVFIVLAAALTLLEWWAYNRRWIV